MRPSYIMDLEQRIQHGLKAVECDLPIKKEGATPYKVEHINPNGKGTYHIIKLTYDDAGFITPPEPAGFKDAFLKYYSHIIGIEYLTNEKSNASDPVRIRLPESDQHPKVTATLDPYQKTMYFSYNKKDQESQLVIREFVEKLLNGDKSQNHNSTNSLNESLI
jgi:hypothetical protein